MGILQSLFGGQNTQNTAQPNVGTGGNSFASLLQIIPAIMAGFKGINTNGQKDTTAQLQNVTNAMYNPSNPLYQQLYGQNKQMYQQNIGNAISQAEGHNRMLSAAGRVPLFSPERNGEAAFRAIVQGQGQAGMEAQRQTESQLGNSANQLAHGLYPLQQNNAESQFGNTLLQGTGLSSIADLLRRGVF